MVRRIDTSGACIQPQRIDTRRMYTICRIDVSSRIELWHSKPTNQVLQRQFSAEIGVIFRKMGIAITKVKTLIWAQPQLFGAN